MSCSYRCPCCNQCVKEWEWFGRQYRRRARCPHCSTLERHRKVCLYFSTLKHVGGRAAYFGPHAAHARVMQSTFPDLKLFKFDFFAQGYRYSKDTIFADVQNIPMQNASLDYVIILHVLEHVPSLRRSLQEIHRVMTSDGVLLHETPCATSKDSYTYCPETNRSRGLCAQKDHLWEFGCRYLRKEFFSQGFGCTNLRVVPNESTYGIMVRGVAPLVCRKLH